MMIKHFVVFFSPGTFVSEESVVDIDSWDIKKAVQLSKSIVERHGAKPYGFCFKTRERGAEDFDSKETKRSGIYYLGGDIFTLAEIEKRADPNEHILRSNMRYNNIARIVINTNSYKSTHPLNPDDTVLNMDNYDD